MYSETERNKGEKAKALLLGFGLDNKDGHVRITKGDNFLLMGGTQETHEKMTETSMKFNEKLSTRGKKLEELSKDEFVDLLLDSSAK